MTKPARQSVTIAIDGQRSLQFGLVHIVYVVALLGTCLAILGTTGIVFALFICALWIWLFTSPSPTRTLLKASPVILICTVLIGLLLPALWEARISAMRMACQANMKGIVLALHNYQEAHGSLPPAYIADESGRPRHSWRVLILPYMEHLKLYEQYDFDEPWNGPNNKQLLSRMPRVYSCPSTAGWMEVDEWCTSYVAITDPATAWPGPHAKSIGQVEDDTAVLVEYHDSKIPWLEPRDLEYDRAVDMLADRDPVDARGETWNGFLYRSFTGRSVAFANLSVVSMPNGIERHVWSELLRAQGKVALPPPSKIEPAPVAKRRLDVGNCFRLGILILATVFPLPWVWINRTSVGGTSTV